VADAKLSWTGRYRDFELIGEGAMGVVYRAVDSALDRTVAIKVKLADGDVGRFIGKAGRNIEAVRTLVRVASLRDRKRVFVDLANQSLAHHEPRSKGSGGGVPA
jgi:predicted RNA-binding protein YlqC (UPF0109 family)